MHIPPSYRFRPMESFCGDTEESTEDISGRRKSKLKSLKTRLFRKNKKEVGEGTAKLSQSASDITAGEGLGSEEDLACPQHMMGSRALSHDSIFLADQDQEDAEPVRVLSQENVHGKIKALQMKLQLQKMHLGPPPFVLPMKRPEDVEGVPHSPAEVSGVDVSNQGTLPMATPQPFSYPISLTPRAASIKSVGQTPSHPLLPSNPPNSSAAEAPLDFNSPAQFTSCLDNSAARHRLSVKPRNQRASTKKRLPATNIDPHTQNNIDHHTQPVKEEEICVQEEAMLEKVETVIPVLPAKLPEVAPAIPEETSQPSSSTLSHQDQALPGRGPSVPSQILRVKSQRAADAARGERPHSSFIPSELKNRKEEVFETLVLPDDKKNTISKVGMIEVEVSSSQVSSTTAPVMAVKSSCIQQQVQGEAGNTSGIKRPTPGSGSFHFSITPARSRDAERPRSGSFAGVLEQTEARSTTGEKTFSSMKEKVQPKDLQRKGGALSVGALHKGSVPPWDGRESIKKVEAATSSTTTETATANVEEAESSQEAVEEAVEAREVEEDEVKTAFGIKLRTTSQSFRLRADASSSQTPKPAACGEQCDKQKREEISGNVGNVSKKQSTNTSCTPSISEDVRLTDPASSGLPMPVKNAPLTCEPQIRPTEFQTISSNPKEAEAALAPPQDQQPVPKTAPPETSWMSLAMEKTRSFQQLFTGRFSRDLAGVQGATRPQAQGQATSQTETKTGAQTQSKSPEAASQPSSDAGKAEAAPSRSQAQTVKLKTTFPAQSHTFRDLCTSKPTSEPQSASQSAMAPTQPQTAQPPLPSSAQTECSSQLAQGSVSQSLAQFYLSSGQQQPSWSHRPQPTNKSATSAPPTVSATSSVTVPPPIPVSTQGEREATVQKREGVPPSGRRPIWTGIVSEKAAFLERQTGRTSPTGSKGVETTKAQAEEQTVSEPPVSVKAASLIKDTKPDRRQGLKPAESSPVKVPGKPCDEQWQRKNVQSPSSPSSSPTIAPACQSTSESGQPSWMELAKRKSMAWSDKSMD